ncbi:MAG: UDP-N-acetylmuramate dehydrogenase [Phycisphaeraceae bacterium]
MLVTDDLLADLPVPHEFDVPLGPRTWFGIGGSAKVLAHPQSIEQLAALVKRCRAMGVPMYVLGAGANLLVADEGVQGVVVELNAPAFTSIAYEGTNGSLVTAGAGVHLFKLVNETVAKNLAGLETLAGIPATLGGAIRMNAGGAFGDIGRLVTQVTLMDSLGEVFTRDRDDLVFSYRSTNISARFILAATLELEEEDPVELNKQFKTALTYKQTTQPLAANSAGCTFKNPPPDPDTGEARPAGKLIDLAGLKETRIGGAEVSKQHANFIVCHKGCTAGDVLALIERMRATVLEEFGVKLEREVVVWP